VRAAATAALVLRDPPATGYLVTGTLPSSQAEAAGLRAGDVLVTYDWRPVPDGDSLRAAATDAGGAATVRVVVVRDGAEIEVDLRPGRLGVFGRGPAGEQRPDTEHANERSRDLDRLAAADLAALVFAEDAAVAAACSAASHDTGRLITAGADALRAGGRVIYAGAGTSGRLALLDAVELGPTFSLPDGRFVALLAGGTDAVFRAREGAEDLENDGVRDLADTGCGVADFVVGVSASGRTPYVLGVLRAARRRGARTGAVVCSRVAEGFPAEIVVHLATGPEVLAGSTRMKAGSATKMVLNAFSLGVMAQLGKVHGNRMVDVRIGSEKLVRRARGLVREIGGVSAVQAAALLESSGGRVKVAIVMGRTGCDAESASRRLEEHAGFLRATLEGDA